MTTLSDRYKDQVVLLTGATGFLGKVVLERVLWEFGDSVRELRVLIRGDAPERLVGVCSRAGAGAAASAGLSEAAGRPAEPNGPSGA